MEDSCLLNSVLQKVPQSLAFFSSLIFLFGWTSFLYPASLGILDATCPPTQAHTIHIAPQLYSLKHTLHRSITWHRPLKNWLRILWAAGFPYKLLQGGWKPASLEGLQTWHWGGSRHLREIAKFNSQRVAQLLTPVSIPKGEIWYTFLSQKSLGTISVARTIHISGTKMFLAPKLRGMRQTYGL